jgi:TldD protein
MKGIAMFELLNEALRASPHWCELRFHRRVTTSVVVDKGELRSAKVDKYGGVGVRVLFGGAWGFSSTSTLKADPIRKAIEEAASIAEFMASAKKEKVHLAPSSPAVGEYVFTPEDPLDAHSIEEKIALVRKTDEDVRSKSPLIVTSGSSYTEYVNEKYIVNSDGVKCHLMDTRPEFRVRAVASKDGRLANGRKSIGVLGGWTDLFSKGTPEELADKAAKLAIDQLDAPYPEGGVFTVVLDPEIVGLLCHEAIGHTVEADFVLSGSAVSGKLGRELASPLVTMCDSGRSEISPLASGSIAVDDEGTAAGRTVIIENGVLKSFLHNRETAALFNVEPTGNARAWEYDNAPIIRMRNTYLEPGESAVEDMLSGIKDGYYLKGAGGGQADANAEFMFAALEAHRVKDGKVGELVREVTISGQAFEVLKSVDAVGDDFKWAMGSGHCGKGQPAKVDGGGPSIRCRVSIGGKQEG